MATCGDIHVEDHNTTIQTVDRNQPLQHSDLHRHALNDNHLRLADILENSSNKLTELKVKFDGLSVLQTACKVNSLNVIDQISRYLDQDDFIDCLKQLSDDGDSTLHLVVREDKTEVLHKLLRSIKDHLVRAKVMEATNLVGTCNSVEQLLEQRERPLLKQLITGHYLVSTGHLQEFFYNFNGSLFGVRLGEERMTIVYNKAVKEDYAIEDLGVLRRLNGCAMICLLCDDLERADHFIKEALAKDRYDIHTLCNRGVLLMKKNADAPSVQDVALQILDIMYEDEELNSLLNSCRRTRSRVDCAYWMAESNRSIEYREKSLEIFEECLKEPTLKKNMREYCSYYYVKILIRFAKEEKTVKNNPKWIAKFLHPAIDMLINISRSTNDRYLGDMWLWLSELQNDAVSKYYWPELSEKFKMETEIEVEINSETCVNKAIEISERASDKKFLARIGKNCLQCGYQSYKISSKKHWFEQALKISQNWIKQHGNMLMCLNTCASALLQMWVISFYSENSCLVRQHYEVYTRRYSESSSDEDLRRYLADSYYSNQISNEAQTVKYLSQVKDYLDIIMEYPDSWETLGIKYARIKSLSGASEDDIKMTFRRAIFESPRGVAKSKAYQHYGLYFLTTGKPEQAKLLFKVAIRECEEPEVHPYKPLMAHRGLDIIRSGEQL